MTGALADVSEGFVERPATPVPRLFGAGKAFAAFGLFLLAQLQVGVQVATAIVMLAMSRGENIAGPAFAASIVPRSMPALLLLTGPVTALIVFVIAHTWARPVLRDASRVGVGYVRARTSTVVWWAVGGIVLAGSYLAVVRWLVPVNSATPLGPLAAAAAAGGMSRVSWAIIAVLFAPVVEETLFRGILLAGLSASWGPHIAAGVVSVIFVVMHLTETARYWPATVVICLLALATLAARRIGGSLYAAVALHAAYNAMFVLAVFLSPES